MKKITALLLAMALVFFLCACGGSGVPAATEEPATETPVETFDYYINKPLTSLMEKVNDLGYTATYLADGVDFTDFIDAVAEDYLVGSVEEDAYAKTVVVDLLLASNAELSEAEEALRQKLEIGYAWSAAEKYGQELYGKEFEINYFMDKIDESLDDENTWFLKAGCKLDGKEMTCEAKVTGTTDSPEVIFFDVY